MRHPSRPRLLLGLLGLASLLLVWPNGGPLSGLDGCGAFCVNDLTKSYIAAFAAMYDPIDWAHPLAISTLRYPFGTSLLLADAFPLLTMPLRLLWQAGIRIDPAIALDLWPALMLVVSPFAVYRLARALGASERAGLVSALLGALSPALRIWFSADRPPYGSQGLAAWPLVALLFAELLDERSGRRRLAAPLIAGALWWANPYLGLVGGAVVAVHAFRAIAARDLRAFAPLVGSMIGLGTLRAADLPLPDGFAIERFTAFLSVVPGLLPWDASIDHPRLWWVWDGASLALFLAAQPLLWRRARTLLLGSWLLAFLSLGSRGEGGGLLPAEIYTATPLMLAEAVDRLFLAGALLGIVGLPMLVERLSRPARRSRNAAIGLALFGAIAAISWAPALADDIDRMGRRIERSGTPVVLDARSEPLLEATRELFRAHEAVLFLPDTAPDCDRGPAEGPDEHYWDAAGQKMGIAWLASTEMIPAYSFYTSRLLYATADEALESRVMGGVACAHMRETPPPGVLVAVPSELEASTPPTTPWRGVVASLSRCTETVEIAPLVGIRFCSDRESALLAFERRLAGLR